MEKQYLNRDVLNKQEIQSSPIVAQQAKYTFRNYMSDLKCFYILRRNFYYLDNYIEVKINCTSIERLVVQQYINHFENRCDCHNPTCACINPMVCECDHFLFTIIEQI